MQICCLTIAPASLAAGIYPTLSHMVIIFGPGNSASSLSPTLVPSSLAISSLLSSLRRSVKFRLFLIALTLSPVCILVRSFSSPLELGEGRDGALIKNQTLFIVFEGVMLVIALLVLNAFHPCLCFREGYIKKPVLQGRMADNAFGRGGRRKRSSRRAVRSRTLLCWVKGDGKEKLTGG